MVDFGVERIGEKREQVHIQKLKARLSRAKVFGDTLIIKEAQAAYDYFKKEYAK